MGTTFFGLSECFVSTLAYTIDEFEVIKVGV